jgi:hypothetical protein
VITMIEIDSLGMLRDPLDLLGPKPMTQEQTEATLALVNRMREFTAKMPPVTLVAALPPRRSVEPVDFMFTFHSLSKENQRLIIRRSKQREPSHFKSIPVFRDEIKDVQ